MVLPTKYLRLKADYMTAHGNTKQTLRKQIVEIKKQIALWTHGGNPAGGFDWRIEFAEVFDARGGFDIVLAIVDP